MSHLLFLLSWPKTLAHHAEPLTLQDLLLVPFSVASLNLDKPLETHSFQCLRWRDHMFICTVLQLALVLCLSCRSVSFSSKSGCRSLQQEVPGHKRAITCVSAATEHCRRTGVKQAGVRICLEFHPNTPEYV